MNWINIILGSGLIFVGTVFITASTIYKRHETIFWQNALQIFAPVVGYSQTLENENQYPKVEIIVNEKVQRVIVLSKSVNSKTCPVGTVLNVAYTVKNEKIKDARVLDEAYSTNERKQMIIISKVVGFVIFIIGCILLIASFM